MATAHARAALLGVRRPLPRARDRGVIRIEYRETPRGVATIYRRLRPSARRAILQETQGISVERRVCPERFPS
jgi:hypothetical protein